MFELDTSYRPIGWPFIYHYDYRRPSWPTIFPHWHTNMELLLVTHGAGVIISGGERNEVTVGDIFVVNSERIHSISSENMKYHVLTLASDFCERIGLPFGECRLEEKITDGTLRYLYESVIEKICSDDPYHKPEAIKCAMELLVYLYDNYTKAKADEKKQRSRDGIDYVKRAMDYINDNMEQKLTLEVIAECVGINKFHLCREFKRHTGGTILFYMNTTKMRWANVLILHGNSIVKAALSVGFDNLPYFSQVYKKYIGETPAETAKKAPKNET